MFKNEKNRYAAEVRPSIRGSKRQLEIFRESFQVKIIY
jgi:hypothetical protein